ncbi:hypothetical protein M406DRAFT_67834 [Cryphonectria parasitica EP155]|uniref:Uncharacterized protein n=1 Tax=Cryphonectria parasitica (strain ATCC 38755 / EP155) TaxID=660469 RepID=A0A9P4Y1Q0_CRYP1|nr:uncharacterized protein M406DRAFT_67834 [Cryphonectria parasitica EP155]KAF3765384.1 hypothetical protein M406DRAFT_67834 [Cryphonectria parasitica EP155]
MSYIPPALREKQQQQQQSATSEHAALPTNKKASDQTVRITPLEEQLYRHTDVHQYYAAKYQPSESPDGDTSALPSQPTSHATLNASSTEPDKLKYVMLFKNANPRWQSDGIIFVKSNISLLPGGAQFENETSPTAKSTTANDEAGKEIGQGEAAVTRTGTNEGESEEKHKNIQSTDTVCEKATPENETKTGDEESTENKSRIKVDNCELQRSDDTDHPTANEQPEPTPSQPSSYSPNLSSYNLCPIAIFEETNLHRGRFRFIGYHKITRLQFLAPYSQETYRMLEQKFSTVDRHGRVKLQKRAPAAWEMSMSYRWAVVKFEMDEVANTQLTPPDINVQGVQDAEKVPRKSVNELLKEMRLEG